MDIKKDYYDKMNIIEYDWFLKCLYFKNTCYLIFNKKENHFIINRDIYTIEKNFNNKTLWDRIKKFFRYYLWKSIINKNDFMNFINQCYNYNWIKINYYDKYYYDWIVIFE